MALLSPVVEVHHSLKSHSDGHAMGVSLSAERNLLRFFLLSCMALSVTSFYFGVGDKDIKVSLGTLYFYWITSVFSINLDDISLSQGIG